MTRCTYCGDFHDSRPTLPYECPGCGRELRVRECISLPETYSVEGIYQRTLHSIMLQEDRRVLDALTEMTGEPYTVDWCKGQKQPAGE